MLTADYLILGAGIVGLSIGWELAARNPSAKIVILEKEEQPGCHASGRNSGVLHSGVFYDAKSLKSRFCSQGSQELAAYCKENRLPILQTGKLIVPTCLQDEEKLPLLLNRASQLGIRAEILEQKQIQKIEPAVISQTGKALRLPEVSVMEPIPILLHLVKKLETKRVSFFFRQPKLQIDTKRKEVKGTGVSISYGHVFNATGLYADKVAQRFGIGSRYRILPMKGLYYRLSQRSGIRVNGLVYAVPDFQMPFLGIHFSRRINGEVFLGPTVIPVFGRENYQGFQGISLREAPEVFFRLLQLYFKNSQGFRGYVRREGFRFWKPFFIRAVQKLAPSVRLEHLENCGFAGIRAQLVDVRKKELVMDFLVEKGENSTHILNAVSPAFTSAFPFARFVLDLPSPASAPFACYGGATA